MRIAKVNSSGVWVHKDDNNPRIDLIMSSGWFKVEGNVFELYGASSGEVRTALIDDVIVEDQTSGGGDETFNSGVELFTRLRSLGYPYFNMTYSSFTENIGYMDYNDTTGDIPLVAGEWTDVPNNGAGAFTNKTYKPLNVNEVIDVSTGYLDFSDLTLGSQLITRNDFSVTPTTNNALLEVRYLLGQGAGEYPLLFWSERLDNGSGIPYQRVPVFTIYMGDANTQGGVGKLQMRLSSNGTLNNAGSYINIQLR